MNRPPSTVGRRADSGQWPSDGCGAVGEGRQPTSFSSTVSTSLFLHDGAICGQRLWPQGWATFLSTPSTTNPEYGGLVWLNSTGRWVDVPQDAYAFSDYLGRTVLLIPSREMVVVRFGFSQKDGFDAHFNHGMARVLAAVDK